jgi:hypothetical protein
MWRCAPGPAARASRPWARPGTASRRAVAPGCVEHPVAGEVGPAQRRLPLLVLRHLHESRRPAPVGDIEAFAVREGREVLRCGRRAAGGDEEGVRPPDDLPSHGRQFARLPGALHGRVLGAPKRIEGALPGLDVARAVAEALAHADGGPACLVQHQGAVEPVAPARVVLQPQQAGLHAMAPAACGRVTFAQVGIELQRVRIGRPGKTGRPAQRGGPGVTLLVQQADHHGRQQRKEGLVLLGHVVADHASAHGFHGIALPDGGLPMAFSGVEGRAGVMGVGHGKAPVRRLGASQAWARSRAAVRCRPANGAQQASCPG